jgi:hypothetical protein
MAAAPRPDAAPRRGAADGGGGRAARAGGQGDRQMVARGLGRASRGVGFGQSLKGGGAGGGLRFLRRKSAAAHVVRARRRAAAGRRARWRRHGCRGHVSGGLPAEAAVAPPPACGRGWRSGLCKTAAAKGARAGWVGVQVLGSLWGRGGRRGGRARARQAGAACCGYMGVEWASGSACKGAAKGGARPSWKPHKLGQQGKGERGGGRCHRGGDWRCWRQIKWRPKTGRTARRRGRAAAGGRGHPAGAGWGAGARRRACACAVQGCGARTPAAHVGRAEARTPRGGEGSWD